MAIDQQKWERDHHFRGFAEAVLEKMKPDLAMLFVALGSPLVVSKGKEIDFAEQMLERDIAQCAYDFATYVINLIPDLVQAFPDVQTTQEVVSKIPDMAAWPDEPRDV